MLERSPKWSGLVRCLQADKTSEQLFFPKEALSHFLGDSKKVSLGTSY
jgi:hypothetical protein